MVKKIVITSGKGGVGKTTFTANLGKNIAKAGKRVLLVDIDFGLNNLDVLLGLENKAVYDIFDVYEGRCRIKQAIMQDPFYSNLFIIPSGSNRISSLSGQSIKYMLESVSATFDYIIIDSPAGIDIGFHRAVSIADEAIVITTPNLTSIKDACMTINILKSYKLNSVDLVVNRVRGDLILNGNIYSPNDISNLLKTRLIGVIPESDSLQLNYRDKDAEINKAFKLITENVLTGKSRVYDATKKYVGFIGSIKRTLKKTL